MSSDEDRAKASRRRKKKILTKVINDRKGPFAVKTPDPRKGTYERVKMRVENIIGEDDDYDTRTDGELPRDPT